MHVHNIEKHIIFKQLSLCIIVTITKIEGTLEILDDQPMIYAFELIE